MNKMILRHNVHARHVETWTWENANFPTIHVKSFCPGNSPSREEHKLDLLEAMRQFILLTSPDEGWGVEEGHKKWRALIEGVELQFWTIHTCGTCLDEEATEEGLCGELICGDCAEHHQRGDCDKCSQPDVYGD